MIAMEKRTPHYRLSEIQAQIGTAQGLRLTESAKLGIRRAGMALVDAVAVVQGLSRRNFYKSMTTNADHRVWQAVYHAEWGGLALYVKFQRDAAGFYFTISFKPL
jgi:motility quorum-sensing regulator/GCU-specific mRNA interferase toxin